MINNLRHWLAPTANRLSDGLKLLEAIADKNEVLGEIIHAFEHNIEDEKVLVKKMPMHFYSINQQKHTLM